MSELFPGLPLTDDECSASQLAELAKSVRQHGIPALVNLVCAGRLEMTAAARASAMTADEQERFISAGCRFPKPEVDHCKFAESSEDELKRIFKSLKSLNDWNANGDRASSVRRLVKTARRLVSEFEKHSTVGAEPNRTLFEADADIPEHLNVPEFLTLWDEWWSERKRRRLSITPSVKRTHLRLLGIGDQHQAVAILGKAIENTWKGIPADIWIPSQFQGLWCNRLPAHADAELLKKIRATPAGRGVANGTGKKASEHGTYREKTPEEYAVW